MLGVDAVQEFNVLRDSYGAEYGKHPGAQVLIVTQSGTNDWHGSAYEFLRNNDLDSRNFFDVARRPAIPAQPVRRCFLGGPIQKDKTFFFANYEGFRQNLHQTSDTFVPAAAARSGLIAPLGSAVHGCSAGACAAVVQQLADTVAHRQWHGASAERRAQRNCRWFLAVRLQKIREDFGTARVDHIFSAKDSAQLQPTRSMTATISQPPSSIPSARTSPICANKYLASKKRTSFRRTLLNTARFGYSRAAYFFLGEPTPGSPAAAVTSFVGRLARRRGGCWRQHRFEPGNAVRPGRQQQRNEPDVFRNLFTYEDQVTLTHGRHQLTFGAWFQQFQSNEDLALSQFGQTSFSEYQRSARRRDRHVHLRSGADAK